MLSEDKIRAQYERAIERSAARLALLETLPVEDPYENGQVLRITRTFNSEKIYVYAALCVDERWYLTGRAYVRYGTSKHQVTTGSEGVSWDALRVWLVESGDPMALRIEELHAVRELGAEGG